MSNEYLLLSKWMRLVTNIETKEQNMVPEIHDIILKTIAFSDVYCPVVYIFDFDYR